MARFWFDDHENLVALAEWMDSEGCFDEPSDVVAFFEKPYLFEEHWKNYSNLPNS